MNKTFLQPIPELEIKESDFKKEPSLGPNEIYFIIRKNTNSFCISFSGNKERVKELLKDWNSSPKKPTTVKYASCSKKDFGVFFESLEK